MDFLSTLNSAELVIKVIAFLLSLHYVWLPFLLFVLVYNFWLSYIRYKFILEQKTVLLEVKIPREITKSPLALEIFYTALHQAGNPTYVDTFISGKVRPWFSLELVSLGGQIHFYIWTWEKYRNHIEAQLYAQIPNIEIHDAEDYTKYVTHDPSKWTMWLTYFKLSDPDPLPIKTYVDYGLDRDPKEEFKIDPMTSILEYMGSMQHGEQLWIQIMIYAHKKEKLSDGRIFLKPEWKENARKLIEKIRKESLTEEGRPNPTKGQQEKVAAIERSLQKWPFEVCIRGAYIATNEANKISSRIAGLIGSFRQYSSNDLNGIRITKYTDFDYKWQDFRRIRRNHIERTTLDAYKKRSFFFPPYQNHRDVKRMILTTEELATIYHFPSAVATTPTLERITSRKGEPPPNLPV